MATEITSKKYWSTVACKLVETFISVKLWILALATYMTSKMLIIVIEIKDFILKIVEHPSPSVPTEVIVPLLTEWSSKQLDVIIAMFTGVIVVVTLSREVFKHTRISKQYEFEKSEPENDRQYNRHDFNERQLRNRII